MSRLRMFLMICIIACAATAFAADEVPTVEFEHYELPNGLDVILHEDHTIPLVGVNIWYHVGSGNEEPGRTGFAHLFEHMMFQGSENHNDDYFMPLQKIGAFVNGSTTEFRTNYLEDVPSEYLELALWLESDRMGFLPGAMDQEKFENQQDVVRNEKREGENQPYALWDETIKHMLYPGTHPYHHTVIGSMDDLTAATLDDVKEFFNLYYTPNNASLCLAGDFDTAEAKALIEKYFAGIPAGRPIVRPQEWIPRLETVRRTILEDAVELPRLYCAWPTPGWYKPGDADFSLLGRILAGGKNSRLYKRLVYDMQIAQDVAAFQDQYEVCSQFMINITAAPGHTLAEIEAVLDEELERLLDKGVTKKELELARTVYETGFVRQLQKFGGFTGRADLLNEYNVMTGAPDYLEKDMARYADVTPKSIKRYLDEYIDLDGRAILHIVPQGHLVASDAAVDRSTMPEAGQAATFTPPAVQSTTLDNGLEIYVVEKPELPLVQANLLFKSGWSADPQGKPGVAAMVGALLDEGTKSRTSLEIAEDAQALGANLGTGAGFDGTNINLNLLKQNLDDGLALVADVARNPSFPDEELERTRQQYLGRIQQESMQPFSIAIKLLQKKVFGEAHPYAQPFTGTGSAASLAALTRQDLVDFHGKWFHPNNAALVVVGGITLEEARRKAEKAFGKWDSGRVPSINVPTARQSGGAKIYVVDRPGAEQSAIVGGHLAATSNDPDNIALEAMNTILGGQFISRINMNLREDKGYTYGARSAFVGFRDSGIFFCNSGVHSQYTKESLVEFIRELEDIGDSRPVTEAELIASKDGLVQGFPQDFETYGEVAGGLGALVQNDLALDDWQTYGDRIRGLDTADITEVVRKHVRPDDMVWVIIGDWATIEAGLKELDLGEVELVDPEAL